MIKSELIQKISKRLPNLSEKDIFNGVNIILEEMTKTLSEGGRIEIRGFGSFSLHYHPPRNAHNPKTGEKVITTGKYTPHFKPGKEFKLQVDDSRHNGSPSGESQLSAKNQRADDEDKD